MGKLGFDLVVADVHAAFMAPVQFDAEVTLALTIERFGRTSMTTHWVTTVDGQQCVSGEIIHVWIDASTAKPIEIPERARKLLSPYATCPAHPVAPFRTSGTAPPMSTSTDPAPPLDELGFYVLAGQPTSTRDAIEEVRTADAMGF